MLVLFEDWGLEIAFSFLRRPRKKFTFQKQLPVTVCPVFFQDNRKNAFLNGRNNFPELTL